MTFKSLLMMVTMAAMASANAAIVFNGEFTGANGDPSSEGWDLSATAELNDYYGRNSVRGGTSSGEDSFLYQDVSLNAGGLYRLTFDAYSVTDVDSSRGIDVFLGDTPLYSRSGDLPVEWTSSSVDFTATAESRLKFVLHDRSSVVALSRVSIQSLQAVPEPGTWTALGLGATALLRRRRR